MVKYICKFWYGKLIPSWRQDCIDRLIYLYPNAKILESDYLDCTLDNVIDYSDKFRLNMVQNYQYCLWVDNDIWLDEPLDLTDEPAMADEYGCWHWSIMWSGNNPDCFKVYNSINDMRSMSFIRKIKITGTHWAMDKNGNKCKRY